MRYDFSRADQVVRQGLHDEAYTAACLLVGQKERVLFRRAYGRLSAQDDAPRANEQTRFDLDSLTRPLVTAMLAFRAMEAGKLCLNDQLGTFIHAPEDKACITIGQLLCHTSGLNGRLDLSALAASPQDAAQVILDAPLTAAPGEKVQYGDAGYILLGQLLECLYHMEMSELAVQEIFWPLKMQQTGYLPKDGNIASTGMPVSGTVFDENARFLGGVSGSAGVFGTMDDLALWMQMIAAQGKLPDGSQYLSRHAIRLMLREFAPGRGLGFAFPGANGFTGDLFPEGTIGHTGLTGCSLAFDPSENVYVIFLTNRVCPDPGNPAIHRIRRLLHNAVYAVI